MNKNKRTAFFVGLTSILATQGCKIEEVQNETFCINVESSKLPNSISSDSLFTPVIKQNTLNGFQIGYINQSNGLTLHSECTAADISTETGNTSYGFWLFGEQVMRDGITSISFSLNENAEVTTTARVINESEYQWSEQTVEGDIKTKNVYTNVPPFNTITIERETYNNNITYTLLSGEITKTKTFDANSQQWNCTWSNAGVITEIQGCANEAATDESILGVNSNSMDLISKFENEQIKYNRNEESYTNDINRYF